MPVLVDRGSNGPIVLGSQREIAASQFACRSINIALINNMPDSALESTERQFAELVAAASSDILVGLRVYSLPDVSRSSSAKRYIDETYSSLDSLWSSRPDGLIVTGAEPRAPELTNEAYWSGLTQLVDWAQYTTVSAIWSCLAAHAAVFHMDGVRRRPLAEKRSGIFKCTSLTEHPLAVGIPHRFAVPHSRFNGLDQGELVANGYTILSVSERAGIDTFVKKTRSTFVLFQGHPEYETETLFREYRRDVARFLRRDSDRYPAMPDRYFPREVKNRLLGFREHALVSRNENLLADFPSVKKGLSNTWRTAAIRIYRNWLTAILAGKAWRPGRMTSNQSRKSAHSAASNRLAQLNTTEGRPPRLGFSRLAPSAAKSSYKLGSTT